MGLEQKTVEELERLVAAWELTQGRQGELNHRLLAQRLKISYREMLLARAYALMV